MTWNVTGLMSSVAYFAGMLKQRQTDFCGLSEHLLLHDNVHFLDSI
jgi:hypothetical protein